MRIALATRHGRMAPCFAGAALRIVDGPAALEAAATVPTDGWHPLGWGRELMRRDVGLLLCAGLDQATWAGLQGHGIQVVPGVLGDPADALAAWRNGRLQPPALWPACPGGRFGGGRRRRFHGGRG